MPYGNRSDRVGGMAAPEWLPHLGHLLGQSVATAWSWTGFGLGAIAVSMIAFLGKLAHQAYSAYRKRYAKFSWAAVMKETRSAVPPTLFSVPTLITLSGWVLLFMIAISVTVYPDS
jgi:hypothetical protein